MDHVYDLMCNNIKSEPQNVEGWIRFAQSLLKRQKDRIPSSDFGRSSAVVDWVELTLGFFGFRCTQPNLHFARIIRRLRNPTAAEFGTENQKFLFRSEWTCAASGRTRVSIDSEPTVRVENAKYGLDIRFFGDIVLAMNDFGLSDNSEVSEYQLAQFQELITKLFQCCQERMQLQCRRFQLPDAELRCLSLFGEERYLTAKGIAIKMNVVKSRVSKIIEGLIRKDLIQRIKDPEDSRVSLLSLTPAGQRKLSEINNFLKGLHHHVLSLMEPDQRRAMLTNLDILKTSMEAVKETMENATA